jgi:uncharacterized protein YkwD
MKQLKIFISFSLLITVLSSAFAAHTSLKHSNNAAMQKEILHYINQYRTTHGLRKLTILPVISQEATQHSIEMARHQIPFGHAKFNDRMNRLYKKIKGSNGGAENVAFNYKNAQVVVEQWLRSPGHRQNIRGSYNLTGIGVARDERGRIYYTQIFVRSLNKPVWKKPHTGL